MKKWLTKEIVIKKSGKRILIESLCSAIAYSLLLYFCLTNKNIVEIFNIAVQKNIELEIVLTLFPCLLIIIIIFNLFVYAANRDN